MTTNGSNKPGLLRYSKVSEKEYKTVNSWSEIGEFVEHTMRNYKTDDLYKDGNLHHMEQFVDNKEGNDGFAGGKFKDLLDIPDIQKYNKILDELKKNDVVRHLMLEDRHVSRRIRRFSSVEGDLDLSRINSDNMFASSIRKRKPVKATQIIVDFTISAHVSAEHIDNYATMVWAICRILELQGIPTAIQIIAKSTGLISSGESCAFVMTVKGYDQYVSPGALASVMRSIFFRKAIFSSWVNIAAQEGKIANSNLGYANPIINEPYKIEPGKIITTYKLYLSKDEFFKKLKEALDVKEESAG